MSKQYKSKGQSDSRKTSRDDRGGQRDGGSRRKPEFRVKTPKDASRDDNSERPTERRRPATAAGTGRKSATGQRAKDYSSDDSRTHKSTTAGGGKRPKFELRDGKFKGKYGADKKKSYSKSSPRTLDNTRLNKYIANSGICSRREADKLITTGMVEVNGSVVTEMGYQVKEGDKVTYAGERLSPEKPVYILLNKPKDYITTAKDPEGRRTVLSLLRGIGDARVFPVGRLDRHTTGLLLLTNDGGLAKKLTHPTHGVKKLYHVHLDKTLKVGDMRKLTEGVDLEDGPMKVDEISYVNASKDKKQVGVEIHSGKNRVVRRLFAHLGYEVVKLDRVLFAGLSKKDLPRGKWRHLSTQELSTLKMLK